MLGNLTRDLMGDRPPQIGGGPFHCARALRRLEVQARIYARCALEDRDELIPQVAREVAEHRDHASKPARSGCGTRA